MKKELNELKREFNRLVESYFAIKKLIETKLINEEEIEKIVKRFEEERRKLFEKLKIELKNIENLEELTETKQEDEKKDLEPKIEEELENNLDNILKEKLNLEEDEEEEKEEDKKINPLL